MLVKRVSRRGALLAGAALAAALAVSGPALAQSAAGLPPMYPAVDPNGVDLTTGQLDLSVVQASVGKPGQGGLTEVNLGQGLRDNLVGTLKVEPKPIFPNNPNNTIYVVSFGGISSEFQDFSGTGTSIQPYGNADGAKLTFDGNSTYTYTGADGTVAVFSTTPAECPTNPTDVWQGGADLTSLTRPNGETLTYTYTSWDPTYGASCGRLQSVVSNLGYMIAYTYAATDGTAASLQLTDVKAINLADEYCDPTANGCATTAAWTHTGFSGSWGGTGSMTATDALQRTTTYTFSNGQLTKIQRPSGATVQVAYNSNGKVASVTNGVGTWTYSYASTPDGHPQTTVTDPNGHTRVVVSDSTYGRITSDQDGDGNTTTYTLTGDLPTTITYPEGNSVDIGYLRGNISSLNIHPIGDTSTSHTITIAYDLACSNLKTCNKPNSITEDGAETDFTYDPNSGLLTDVKQPAGQNGVRPEIGKTVSPHYADYYTAPGVISQSPTPVYKVDQSTQCITGSQPSCIGTTDEARTVYNYGSGAPTNLLPVSITQQDGTGALAATSAFTYNINGDLKTVDGPLAGTADTIRYRYDNDRELVGFVGADPDAPDSGRPSNAVQYDYTPDGLILDTKYGTVASQSDADWANFTKLETIGFVRDNATRVTQKFVNTFPNGVATKQNVTQYTYDNANRLTCSAVRMNPSAFASLPADACTQGTAGSYGPDRITQYGYDNADRPTTLTEGVGTSSQAVTQTLTYTPNGRLHTLADGNGNLTTFDYDNWTRLSEVQFPAPANPGLSSPTDDITYTYDDTTWNVTSEKLRDGETVTNDYDARQNLISKTLPQATTYAYDNLDRPITATAAGITIGETYDALGRRTAESQPLGTVNSQYDLAGRRTQLSLPDGTHTTYDYDNAGAMSDIKDTNGATLVTFGYDNFNRLQTLSRANGVTTTYGYDTLSRVTSLGQAFAGTNNPSNVTITLAYDPADEIVSRTLSNSAYHWAGSKATTNYGVNGLNQLTNAGPTNFSYDLRGNLTNDGTKSYGYDAANRLTSAGQVSLKWDPLDRLNETVEGMSTTQFLYDGPNIVAEYTGSGGEQKRYVFGPGVDQPLVDYESNTTDWPLADERGSIISLADNSGNSMVTNTYDEYGLPGAGNYGRFQYTGQAWLSDTGLYSYKARAYSPVLGRFMQTDPTGYAGGPNLYSYADNDPISSADPTGTIPEAWYNYNYASWNGYDYVRSAANGDRLYQNGNNQFVVVGQPVVDPHSVGIWGPGALSSVGGFKGDVGGGADGTPGNPNPGGARTAPEQRSITIDRCGMIQASNLLSRISTATGAGASGSAVVGALVGGVPVIGTGAALGLEATAVTLEVVSIGTGGASAVLAGVATNDWSGAAIMGVQAAFGRFAPPGGVFGEGASGVGTVATAAIAGAEKCQ